MLKSDSFEEYVKYLVALVVIAIVIFASWIKATDATVNAENDGPVINCRQTKFAGHPGVVSVCRDLRNDVACYIYTDELTTELSCTYMK